MNFVSHCAEDIAGRGEFRGCEGETRDAEGETRDAEGETLALIIGK